MSAAEAPRSPAMANSLTEVVPLLAAVGTIIAVGIAVKLFYTFKDGKKKESTTC